MRTSTKIIALCTVALTALNACKKGDGGNPDNSGTGIGFTVDNSFTAQTNPANFLVLQSDKKVISASSNKGIIRINAYGSTDNSFHADATITGTNNYYSAIALQADGKVIVLANDNSNLNPIGIYRLNADGTMDAGFHAPGLITTAATRYYITSVLTLSDGGLIVGGKFEYNYSGTNYYNVARLKSDGSLDAGFKSPVSSGGTVTGLALATDGQVIISGRFSGNLGPGITNAFLKVNGQNAAVDANFRLANKLWSNINNVSGTSFENGAAQIFVLSDGKYLIHGDFYSIGPDASSGNNYPGLARLNSDGSEDVTFKPDVQYSGPVAPLADGKILMGKYAPNFSGGITDFLTVLDGSGKMLYPYNSLGFDKSSIGTLLKLSETEFLMGGTFTKGTTDLGIVKIKK